MFVKKRDGRKEEVYLDKITSRIQKLCYGLNMDFIDPLTITLEVIKDLYPGVTTTELDSRAAEIAAMKMKHHPHYGTLAARIAISNLHKETKKHFSDVIEILYKESLKNASTPEVSPIISPEFYNIVAKNAHKLNSAIIYDRDFSFTYKAFKVLESKYLLRLYDKIVERPQHMLMRVAVAVHGEDIDSAIQTYNLLSEKYFLFDSQTLIAAGLSDLQHCSTYSLMMPDDSIDGIFSCVERCGLIIGNGGTVGVNIHNIRATGTFISGTNGHSNGLVPMLRVFDNASHYFDDDENNEKNVMTIYLEPWHADIFKVLTLKNPSGKEEVRARALNYALWIPDLFMKRVETNGVWSIMCPDQCPGLSDCFSEEFEKLYTQYETEKRFVKQVQAQDLWKYIIKSQTETGMPHMLYKDTCNARSNQKHLGIIKGGSFGADVVQFTSPDHVGVSSSASISLNMFVEKVFNFKKLKDVTKSVVKSLNCIIDMNNYTLEEAKATAKQHRSIAVGVQGLADALILLKIPYESEEAQLLNKQIFETIYYGALEASCELAEQFGPYDTYEGSPTSKGVFQYNMWNMIPSNLWNWEKLLQKISEYGLRNSLLLACMPTHEISEILDNTNSVDPISSNIYSLQSSSGTKSLLVNDYLIKDLNERGLWNDEVKKLIISNDGSIQDIPYMPEDLRKVYRTAWEISQKSVLNMAIDRSAFVDHSQAVNIFIQQPTYAVMSSVHFYGWRRGLKTGMYYLKSKASTVKTNDVIKNETQVIMDAIKYSPVKSPKPSPKKIEQE